MDPLQKMLDELKESIVQSFEKQFSKLNERIDKLESSFNLHIQALKCQFDNPNEPAQQKLLVEEKLPQTLDLEAKNDTRKATDITKEACDTEMTADERRLYYDIMCLVLNKRPTPDDKNFESDAQFSEIMKKLENDLKYSKSGGLNIYNRNLAIYEDLRAQFAHNTWTTNAVAAENELEEVKQKLSTIKTILGHPVRFSDIYTDNIYTVTFDRQENYAIKYVAFVCLMYECHQVLQKIEPTDSKFEYYWYLEE